ncbi:MAG: hypothetical protein HDR01_11270 [Lachnospiraceae bacterium]|nr:hypothetical protein [Lachnospiraceae bacterium]
MKKHKVFYMLLSCNLVLLFPSVFHVLPVFNIINPNVLEALVAFPVTEWWLAINIAINIIYGFFFSIPAIIIICFSTLFIIIKDYKQKHLTKKNLVMLLISCLLNVVALLCSLDLAMIWASG